MPIGPTTLRLQGVKVFYKYKVEELKEVMTPFLDKMALLQEKITKVIVLVTKKIMDHCLLRIWKQPVFLSALMKKRRFH